MQNSIMQNGQRAHGNTKQNSAPAKQTFPRRTMREGDAHWLRVMETKENQWRFLHTLALHEMHVRERTACAELDNLSKRLDHLVTACESADRTLQTCRTRSFHQQITTLASTPVHQAVQQLQSSRYHNIAEHILDADSAVVLPSRGADCLVEQFQRFRQCAQRFRDAVDRCGVDRIAGLADLVERLAATVAMESAVVVDTAAHVSRAGRHGEMARSALLTDVVQRNVLEPTESVPTSEH